MPARLAVGLIAAFWILTAGYVVRRDVWPHYFGDEPPTVLIDLADEATQIAPAKWTLYNGDVKSGTLVTTLIYVQREDAYYFSSKYKNIVYTVESVRCRAPELTIYLSVNSAGELRSQSMKGKFVGEVLLGPIVVFSVDADADLQAQVVGGELVGTVKVVSSVGTLEEALEPVPATGGQVLNPLQPVNRLSRVRPGQRWVVHEVNPLTTSLLALARKLAKENTKSAFANFKLPEKGPLVATVLDEPQKPKPGAADCWVIEYRREAVEARTWVRVDDGKVLRQETVGEGPSLRWERED